MDFLIAFGKTFRSSFEKILGRPLDFLVYFGHTFWSSSEKIFDHPLGRTWTSWSALGKIFRHLLKTFLVVLGEDLLVFLRILFGCPLEDLLATRSEDFWAFFEPLDRLFKSHLERFPSFDKMIVLLIRFFVNL